MANDKKAFRVNHEIIAKEVRLIDQDGKQIGVMSLMTALESANKLDLDLIEIAPNSEPPICKIANYNKFLYEQHKKEKLAKRNQKVAQTKEIRLHPTTDTHDFQFKARHARKFLEDGNKVKATVEFKGRQKTHQELGYDIINRFINELTDLCVVEREPIMDGRFIVTILAPGKK